MEHIPPPPLLARWIIFFGSGFEKWFFENVRKQHHKMGTNAQNFKLGFKFQVQHLSTRAVRETLHRPYFSWQSGFQMAVESYYAIALQCLSLAPVLQPMRSKTKTNRTLNAWFFPRLEQFSGNYEEFWLVRFLPLLWLGQSNYFSTVFLTVI